MYSPGITQDSLTDDTCLTVLSNDFWIKIWANCSCSDDFILLITVVLQWARWRLKSPALRLFTQPRRSKKTSKLAFVRGIHRWPVNLLGYLALALWCSLRLGVVKEIRNCWGTCCSVCFFTCNSNTITTTNMVSEWCYWYNGIVILHVKQQTEQRGHQQFRISFTTPNATEHHSANAK